MGPQFDYCLRATNNPSYFAFPDKDVTDNAGPQASGSEQYSRSAPARAWAEGARPLSSPRRREPESPRRKEFRALLRSLSAKEPEQAEAFLKGQPRPGDCAPGDMRNTFTAPRIKKGKISSKVVTSNGTKDNEEVFYTIPLHGRRRHSVGGYLATGSAGAGEVTAVPSEVPKMPPPKINQTEEDAVTRRRPKNFNFKGNVYVEMDREMVVNNTLDVGLLSVKSVAPELFDPLDNTIRNALFLIGTFKKTL